MEDPHHFETLRARAPLFLEESLGGNVVAPSAIARRAVLHPGRVPDPAPAVLILAHQEAAALLGERLDQVIANPLHGGRRQDQGLHRSMVPLARSKRFAYDPKNLNHPCPGM